MNFLERLDKLLNQKGITTNKMCTDLKIGKNSVVNWRERGNLPNGDTLQKMADYFGVSVDYLLCRTENPAVVDDEWLATPIALSAPEGYDALTEEGKKQIQELIKILPKNTQD